MGWHTRYRCYSVGDGSKAQVMTQSQTQLLYDITARVIDQVAPEERGVLDAPGFPHVNNKNAPTGPLGIGFETALVLVAPLVYVFFESLVREGAKATASQTVTRLFKGNTVRVPSEEEVRQFFVEKGLEAETAETLVTHILRELEHAGGDGS